MGLLPPDPPKVRLANLMKVLTSDAVADPTRVEAKVRREVAMRKHNHDKTNEERKLTDEQRREKIETKKAELDKKGLIGVLFKIKTLSDPAHKFKVRKNAEQRNLTGMCIINQGFSIVYVEGAHKFITHYKKLMLNRINWTEPARARGSKVADEDEENEADGEKEDAGAGPSTEVVEAGKEEEAGADAAAALEDNRCDSVWEGALRERAFVTFRVKTCPTDSAAKEALGTKLQGLWDQAKAYVPLDEVII